ncbi:hypothetical protein N480_10165 [Pseudoalteromonas luteoviolacea S2607]|uniref:hypothetical protein n=1 Tax=Pseudoalteromonas luteoviolacea TaxID=43657 RepID=UPI0007B03DC6|nr:hypothetical protein [Pseudoalteromonas luteoviolacea]KZN28449.1 hypothetical protein N480_10165 [Pseudoalteromonas luteoviolacea S2607]
MEKVRVLFATILSFIVGTAQAEYLQFNTTAQTSEIYLKTALSFEGSKLSSRHLHLGVKQANIDSHIAELANHGIEINLPSLEQMQLSASLSYLKVNNTTSVDGLHFLAVPDIAKFPLAVKAQSKHSVFHLSNFALLVPVQALDGALAITSVWDPNYSAANMTLQLAHLNSVADNNYVLNTLCEITLPQKVGVSLFKHTSQGHLKQLAVSHNCIN